MVSVNDPNQTRIDQHTRPIGDHRSREIVLREVYDRPRHIRAMIALCSKKRLALSATDWPELHELILSGNSMMGIEIKMPRRTLVRLLSKNHHQFAISFRTIEMGWFIMNKYYELTDIVFAYATALLLDPSKRAAYIRQDWPEESRLKLMILPIKFGQKNIGI
jgi:transposase